MVRPKERIAAALEHREAPPAWTEMLFHKEVAAGILGAPVGEIEAGNPDFASQVALCQSIGLCAVGQAIYDRFGSHRESTGRSYQWVPHIRDWADLSKLQFPDLALDRRRVELDEVRAAIGDTGLAFFPAGMFCVATSMNDMGFENFCTKLHDDPRLVRTVMEGYAEYNARLIEFYSSQPEVDFLWIADDIAYHSTTFFSPRTFRQHILPIWRDMVTCIRKPWIFHSDGNLETILDDLLSLGMAGLHPIEPGAMDILDLKQRIGHRVALVGNVDMGLLTAGDPWEVERTTGELLDKLRAGGGYLLSSANSISADVQPANVVAMGRALKRLL